jgi:redox-sensitive bicupin YhaK (pirin superfamily)
MRIVEFQLAKKTYPTGDPSFSVLQAFPSGVADSDPFLMCDHFGPTPSKGKIEDPDRFPVQWHPHRGMDILTYLVSGVGRHADSLGNRGEYATPGMQWISVGSGIEHAEGGGSPAGVVDMGFQIWVNVPGKHKMEDPRYGIEPPENIPFLTPIEGVTTRLLAGRYGDAIGPFETKQDVQIMDYMLEPNTQHTHLVVHEHDNCIVYVYKGAGSVAGTDLPQHYVARLNAEEKNLDTREITFQAGAEGLCLMLFAGKRINEPIAWRGPFVMNTQEEIQQTLDEYRRGAFPPVRAKWDYKVLAAKPKDNSCKKLYI